MMTDIKRPAWVAGSNPGEELHIDLGRYLRYGLEALPAVEEMLSELRPCQVLHLTSAREPVMLYEILKNKGFENFNEAKNGTWHSYFRQCDGPARGQA
ncbi:MAG TPA: hypothetical protein VMU88_00095 [bacterium]|nr:hypothetical protein [bacterium]